MSWTGNPRCEGMMTPRSSWSGISACILTSSTMKSEDFVVVRSKRAPRRSHGPWKAPDVIWGVGMISTVGAVTSPSQPSPRTDGFQGCFYSNASAELLSVLPRVTCRHVSVIIHIIIIKWRMVQDGHQIRWFWKLKSLQAKKWVNLAELNAIHQSLDQVTLCKQLSCSSELNLIVCLFAWTMYDFLNGFLIMCTRCDLLFFRDVSVTFIFLYHLTIHLIAKGRLEDGPCQYLHQFKNRIQSHSHLFNRFYTWKTQWVTHKNTSYSAGF